MNGFSLNVFLDRERKITEINSKYLIKIKGEEDLSKSFYIYGVKFYNAANYISKFLICENRNNIGELDTYFFSVAYLYRHCIELMLKAIAFRKILDKEERIGFAKETFHDLSILLDRISEYENCSRSKEEIEWLKKYFSDLSTFDKESDAFRYPFHIKREKQQFSENKNYFLKRVFEKQTHIDLCKFVNKFEVAFEILRLWYENNSNEVTEWKGMNPVFIEEGGSYYGQSVVGYGYKRDDFYSYVKAYKETASYLRRCIIDDYDKGNIETAEKLFIPMLYLYRNATELSMKSLWFEGRNETMSNKCKILQKKKHSIEGMWNHIKEWIKNNYGQDEDEAEFFELLEKHCKALQGYDSTSSRFRYPCDKEMKLHFKTNTTFDIIAVAEFMESIIVAFECIADELSRRNEYLDEMEAEYRNENSYDY